MQEEGLAEQLQNRLRELAKLDVEDLCACQEELGLTERLVSSLKNAAAANCRAAPEQAQQRSRPATELQLAAV